MVEMKKLNIAVFFHRFDDGGAEKMTLFLARALKEAGHSVTILIRHDCGPLKNQVPEGVMVTDFALPEKRKLIKNIRNIVLLRRAMMPGGYDVLLAVTAEMSQVAALAAVTRRKRIPLVSVVHSTLSMEVHSFQRMRELLFPVLNRKYDRVIAVSEAVRRDYIEVCRARKEQVVTIYNPVVNQEIFRLQEETASHPWLSKDRGFVTLVLAGRLSPVKNHRLMFQTLKQLNERGDYRLILLGEGELQTELEELACFMGIRRKVDFTGYVENPYVFFKMADAVVLTSIYEGLPSVLIEALACGARIVSVDCPSGPREILADGVYGRLVRPQDETALAEGILESLRKRPDKALLKSRAMEFSAEKAAERYADVLMQLVKGGAYGN